MDRVLDPAAGVIEPRTYRDAAEYALQRLSRDFDVTYTTDDMVPWDRLYLFICLATAYLARIRAANEATSSGSSTSAMTEIEVPNLRVQESTEELHGAEFWDNFADECEAMYDAETGGPPADALPEVVVGFTTRQNLRTGGKHHYSLDEDPAAPTNFAAAVSGSDVVLTWDKVTGIYMAGYEIYRAAASADLDVPLIADRLYIIPDVHGWPVGGIIRPRRTDAARPSGTWYYKIASINKNGLRGFSGTVSAVVP